MMNDIIKVSGRTQFTIDHNSDCVDIETRYGTPTAMRITMTREEMETMIAQYLLLRHMERMKALSTEELLNTLSIQL